MIPGLIARLADTTGRQYPYGQYPYGAAEALAGYTWDASVVEALKKAMRHPDPQVARMAASSLGPLGIDEHETEPVR